MAKFRQPVIKKLLRDGILKKDEVEMLPTLQEFRGTFSNCAKELADRLIGQAKELKTEIGASGRSENIAETAKAAFDTLRLIEQFTTIGKTLHTNEAYLEQLLQLIARIRGLQPITDSNSANDNQNDIKVDMIEKYDEEIIPRLPERTQSHIENLLNPTA